MLDNKKLIEGVKKDLHDIKLQKDVSVSVIDSSKVSELRNVSVVSKNYFPGFFRGGFVSYRINILDRDNVDGELISLFKMVEKFIIN